MYLVYDDIFSKFYDVDTDIEWQPRHYDVAEINTWETGITDQTYADIDQFDLGEEISTPQEINRLEYQMEQGHYIAPVEVSTSGGRLKVVKGLDTIRAANGMRMKNIPYEISATNKPLHFNLEDNFDSLPVFDSSSFRYGMNNLGTKINTLLNTIELSSGSFSERSGADINALLPDLISMPEMSEVGVGSLIYWLQPHEGEASPPTTHFFIYATFVENGIVIDPAARWSNALGANLPILSTESEWAKNVKKSLSKSKDVLAKINFNAGEIEANLSANNKLGPFDEGPMLLMYRPAWYSRDYFAEVKALEQRRAKEIILSRTKNLGPADTDGVAILTPSESRSGLSIHQKNISDRFKLYRTNDGPGEVLFLSAHGGYMVDTGEVAIPENIIINFLGPHTRPLIDPGISLIHDDDWLPFAEVGRNSEVLNPDKNKGPDGIPHVDVNGDTQMIYGSDIPGLVKNYLLDQYDGYVNSGKYSTETPEIIAKAIDQNRMKETMEKIDVLTVRASYSGEQTQLSHLFDLLEKNPELKTYKKLIFSACRVDLTSGPDPKGYILKSKELVITERTLTGWRITGIVPIPVSASQSEKQS